VPSPLEVSADHRATFAALQGALATLPDDAAPRILAYEVNHPLHPDVLVDVGGQVALIERAMGCYASQQEQHDYLSVKLGLLRFRTLTLPPAVEAAEAYRRFGLDELVGRRPVRVVTEAGGASGTAT